MPEREEFREPLKELLKKYEGKKIRPLHMRLLQGIKAKYLLRFEERKKKIEAEKKRQREVMQLKKKASLTAFKDRRSSLFDTSSLRD